MGSRLLFLLLFAAVSGLLTLAGCKKDMLPEPGDPAVPQHDPTPYQLKLPAGLPAIYVPANNPLTEEGVELGRMLFYDKTLSVDNTISCASCHSIDLSFSDDNQFSTGVNGQLGTRNSMPLVNLIFQETFFWDGRAQSLEDQILIPIQDHKEMAENLPSLMDELKNHPDYPGKFHAAFGTKDPTPELLAKAVAQFLRTIVSVNSKYDRYVRGPQSVDDFLTDDEQAGYDLMMSVTGADCFHCHSDNNAMFGDFTFNNNGLDAAQTIHDFPDPGLGGVTGDTDDYGLFKTPSLRNIALTAPYMHDGRYQTLEEVIDFYSEGLQWSETIDPLMKRVEDGGVQLTPRKNRICWLPPRAYR